MIGSINRTHQYGGLLNIIDIYTREDGLLDVSVSLVDDNEDGSVSEMEVVMTPEDVVALGNWAQVIESCNKSGGLNGRRY